MNPDLRRKHPAHGVFTKPSEPTLVFVAVCTANRLPWLAAEEPQRLVCEVWRDASAWSVGRYVIMPDHLHFFCAPGPQDIPFERWMSYWKRLWTQRVPQEKWRWQSGHWDTRLRRDENYAAKWEYVRQNPVRAGLAAAADAWRYQGELNHLPW